MYKQDYKENDQVENDEVMQVQMEWYNDLDEFNKKKDVWMILPDCIARSR